MPAAIATGSSRAMGKRLVSVVVKDVLGGREDLALQLAPSLSLAELKWRLCMTYPDSPIPSRQRIVCHARHILNDETVGSLLGPQQAAAGGAAGGVWCMGAKSAAPDAPLELFVTIHPRA